MVRRRLLFIVVSLGFGLMPGPAYAQTTAMITGSVVDAETNAPLPGVNVYLAYSTRGAATDSQGRYVIYGVPPGSYELVASMLG